MQQRIEPGSHIQSVTEPSTTAAAQGFSTHTRLFKEGWTPKPAAGIKSIINLWGAKGLRIDLGQKKIVFVMSSAWLFAYVVTPSRHFLMASRFVHFSLSI